MERIADGKDEAIILFVSIPDCVCCRERVQTELEKMKCWERVELGYPMDYGTKIWLFCKNDKETDYWERAKDAKRILEGYHYRVM